MPPEQVEPGSPADWLRHARSDLELARVDLPPGVLREGLCFHAQQAAEKALKGLLLKRKILFPKTHNIRALLDRLPPDLPPPEDVAASAILNDYAVVTRYPSNLEPVSEEEYHEAVRLAKAVVEWAETEMQDA